MKKRLHTIVSICSALFLICLLVIPIDASSEVCYPVEFSYIDKETGKVATKTVCMNVIDQQVATSNDGAEKIIARDVKLDKKLLANELTTQQLIDMAQAKAWKVDTGESVPITKVTTNQTTEYTFNVTFATEKNTKVMVTFLYVNEPIKAISNFYMPPFFRIEWLVQLISIILILLIPVILLILVQSYQKKQVEKIDELLFENNISNLNE